MRMSASMSVHTSTHCSSWKYAASWVRSPRPMVMPCQHCQAERMSIHMSIDIRHLCTHVHFSIHLLVQVCADVHTHVLTAMTGRRTLLRVSILTCRTHVSTPVGVSVCTHFCTCSYACLHTCLCTMVFLYTSVQGGLEAGNN